MTTLGSIQKEHLLRQVQQRGYSIRVEQIVELIKKYDNLEIEDFAPPILPYEVYERIKYLFEEEAWKRLLQRTKRNEEELQVLIQEVETYISYCKGLKQSHVKEALSMLNDLRSRLVQQQKERKQESLLEQHLDKLNDQMKEIRECKSATYIQKVTCNEFRKSNKNDISHIGNSNTWLCTECYHIFKINDENGLLCPKCGGTLKRVEKVQSMEKPGSPNCLMGLLKLPFGLIGFLTSSIHSLVKDCIATINNHNSNAQNVSYDSVFSSIFAPAEVKPKSHVQVQVYLHLYEETEKVKALAQESDKNAERRDYIPLQCKLKKEDKVDVLLNIYGETLLMSDKKSVVWQGSFTKCSFDYFVPKDIEVDELSCVAMLKVNEVPVGEMRFITRIVDAPRQLNPEIIAHKYNKVFISYSHQDESKVKFLHEGLELGAVPHFFDRKYLKTGDVFPQVIKDYINSADLFILCWSENASKSEYVQKERLQALERAFPQVKPEQEAKLRIYPMSIEPRAELPGDMKENYHFGEI